MKIRNVSLLSLLLGTTVGAWAHMKDSSEEIYTNFPMQQEEISQEQQHQQNANQSVRVPTTIGFCETDICEKTYHQQLETREDYLKYHREQCEKDRNPEERGQVKSYDLNATYSIYYTEWKEEAGDFCLPNTSDLSVRVSAKDCRFDTDEKIFNTDLESDHYNCSKWVKYAIDGRDLNRTIDVGDDCSKLNMEYMELTAYEEGREFCDNPDNRVSVDQADDVTTNTDGLCRVSILESINTCDDY